jgi:hypothetical protein
MSKVIVLTMTDEDFDDVWKMVNQSVELSEEKTIALLKAAAPELYRNPAIGYRGLFDIPEEYLSQIGQTAKMLYQSDIEIGCSVLLWRLIQGVLKNR